MYFHSACGQDTLLKYTSIQKSPLEFLLLVLHLHKQQNNDILLGWHIWITEGIKIPDQNSRKYNRSQYPPLNVWKTTVNKTCIMLAQHQL